MLNVKIIDTEATDLDPKTAQVIELAHLEIVGSPLDIKPTDVKMADTFNGRFRPNVPIKFGAMATHHILPGDLEGELPSLMVPEQWQDHGLDYVIGHNIDFDAEILGGLPGAKRICTLALARFLLPDLDSHKQGAVLYYYACTNGFAQEARFAQRDAHSALADVKMCHTVLCGLIAEAFDKGYHLMSWEDVYQLSELARIPTVMGFGKYKGTPIKDIDKGYVSWYRKQSDTDPFYLKAFELAGF